MNYSPTTLIRERLNELEGVHRTAVLEGGALRKAFVRKQSMELNISIESVAHEIEKVAIVEAQRKDDLSLLAQHELVKIEKLSQAEKQAQQAQWHDDYVLRPTAKAQIIQERMKQGYTLDEAVAQGFDPEELTLTMQTLQNQPTATKPKEAQSRNKYNILMKQIVDVLKQSPEGVTKTEILTILKKNGNWRQMRNDVLDYLEVTNKVRKVGTKYYHISNAGKVLETDFHRRVYESLADSEKSINKIMQTVGYNNQTGRRKVKSVLHLLWREGLVIKTANGCWAISP